jgi:rhamnosyltransferase
MSGTPAVSVLIRTRNEAASIARTLDLVALQTPVRPEIVVVDSGSTDGTLEIVERRAEVRLLTIPRERFSYGRSLNIGFAAARGSLVVPLSAHAYPRDEHWLARLIRPFEDPRVAGVYGRQLPHLTAWPFVRGDYLRCFGDRPRVQTRPDRIDDCFFSSANAAVRRSAWNAAAFDEDLPYAEDQLWAKTMLKLGYIIRYEPDAAVYHSHNESLLKVYRRTCNEYQAQRAVHGVRKCAGDALRYWWNAVRQDLHCIRHDRDPLIWALRSPAYRFVRALGSLRPSLPGAPWQGPPGNRPSGRAGGDHA